jgi:hypothetical protein
MTQSTIEPDVIGTTIESANIEELLNPYDEDDGSDKNRKAHYVTPGDNLEFQHKYGPVSGPQELVNNARFHRAEIVAVCGYRWVPKLKPEAYPVCSACVEIAANRIMGE